MSRINLVQKAHRIIRNRGISGLFKAARSKIYYSHHSIWFARELDESLETIRPRFAGRLDFGRPDEIRAWISEMNIPGTNDTREISDMLDKGHYFVGIMNGQELIGYIKIGWGAVYILDYDIELAMPPDTYFYIDIFVHPGARGLGAGPFLVSSSAIEMKKRGFIGGIMHVRTNKTAMLRTCATAGFKEFGHVNYRSMMGLEIFRPHPSVLIDSLRHEFNRNAGDVQTSSTESK